MLISKFGTENISEKIEIYEDRANIKLPEQLRNFIEKYNGGETPNTKFNSNGISSDVKAFYGLGKVKYSFDSVKIIEDNGNRYLPFALDSFGNELVIDITSGAILFMDHEKGELQRLADDFKSFVDICDSSPINPSSIKSIEEREQDLIKNGHGSIITDALRDMWKTEIDKYTSIKQEKVNL